MKNRDLFAFILFYASSIGILALFITFWRKSFPINAFFYVFLILLVLFLGYLFAKYLLSPLAKRNEELDRLLKETLHELNIPIATIKANVQLLRKNSACSQKHLNRIQKAADQLMGLYEEVRYLIKKEINQIEKKEVELDLIVRERVEFFTDLLKDREVIVDLEPMRKRLSKQGFVKAFDNLLSNAIKYSAPGTKITIRLRDKRLEIEDEGKGIAQEDLLRIFDRYYQSDGTAPGFGIGLSIVKEFCDEEGIGIQIRSQVGKGTKVILDLTKN